MMKTMENSPQGVPSKKISPTKSAAEETSPRAEKHFLRFVLPFSFAEAKSAPVDLTAYKALLEAEDNDNESLMESRVWQKIQEKDENKFLEMLFPFYRQFLSQSAEPPSCLMFTLSDRVSRQLCHTEDHQEQFFELWTGGKKLPAEARFEAVYLFLFATGVGFLVFQLKAMEIRYQLTSKKVDVLRRNSKYRWIPEEVLDKLENDLKDNGVLSIPSDMEEEFVGKVSRVLDQRPCQILGPEPGKNLESELIKLARFDLKQPSIQSLCYAAWHLRDLKLYEEVVNPLSVLHANLFDRHGIDQELVLFRRRPKKPSNGDALKGPGDEAVALPDRCRCGRFNQATNLLDFASFSLTELIAYLLMPFLCKPQEAIEDKLQTCCLINKYLIGYHFVLTEPYDHEAQKEKDLFLLRRSYKETYMAAPRDLRLADNPEVVRTFESITFGQSLEGGVTMVEKITDHPFYQGFESQAQWNYFMPFLLALHQRFALIHFAIHMARLKTDNQDEVRRLRESVLDFVLKWRFGQVSNISHYNRVYENWRGVLELDALVQEVKSEVSELDEHLERKSRQKMDSTFWLVNIVLFPLLIITGFFGMNIRPPETWEIYDYAFWIVGVIIFLFYFLLVWLVHCGALRSFWRKLVNFHQ